jgi:hypothetical protein
VYCVDNVGMATGENELVEFVSSLGVRVITCHEVKPRQSAWQRKKKISPSNRAFRLCINRADNNLFLQENVWPSDILISKWYFANKADGDGTANGQQAGTAGDADTERTDAPVAAGAAAAARVREDESRKAAGVSATAAAAVSAAASVPGGVAGPGHDQLELNAANSPSSSVDLNETIMVIDIAYDALTAAGNHTPLSNQNGGN